MPSSAGITPTGPCSTHQGLEKVVHAVGSLETRLRGPDIFGRLVQFGDQVHRVALLGHGQVETIDVVVGLQS